jgi:hypothetical protein
MMSPSPRVTRSTKNVTALLSTEDCAQTISTSEVVDCDEAGIRICLKLEGGGTAFKESPVAELRV